MPPGWMRCGGGASGPSCLGPALDRARGTTRGWGFPEPQRTGRKRPGPQAPGFGRCRAPRPIRASASPPRALPGLGPAAAADRGRTARGKRCAASIPGSRAGGRRPEGIRRGGLPARAQPGSAASEPSGACATTPAASGAAPRTSPERPGRVPLRRRGTPRERPRPGDRVGPQTTPTSQGNPAAGGTNLDPVGRAVGGDRPARWALAVPGEWGILGRGAAGSSASGPEVRRGPPRHGHPRAGFRFLVRISVDSCAVRAPGASLCLSTPAHLRPVRLSPATSSLRSVCSPVFPADVQPDRPRANRCPSPPQRPRLQAPAPLVRALRPLSLPMLPFVCLPVR